MEGGADKNDGYYSAFDRMEALLVLLLIERGWSRNPPSSQPPCAPGMVQLQLATRHGKTALRLWPFEGHLALTPVTVHGVVRTLPDADLKPLPTSSITVSVKCIESRVGLRANVSRILAEYSKVLWSKPDDQEFADVPLLELPFRIVIPTDTPGFSTSLFLEYRCVWRVEAVLHHIPLPVVGHRQIKHFQLPLISYALPPFAPTPSFTLPPLHQQTHKPGVPSVRYTVNAPTTPIGPLDMVSVPIYLLPLDPGLTVRSASAVVERRIQFSSSVADPSGLPPSSESLTIPFTTDLTNNSSTSLASYSQTDATVSVAASEDSSNPTITPHTFFPSQSTVHQPLLPPRPPLGDELSPPQSSSSSSVPSNTRVSVVQIATTQSSGAFSLDPTRGIFSKTLTLQWPESKSYSRWQVGSTLQSDLVSIRFYLRIKIVVLTGSSSSNTQTLELAEQELLIVPTNDAERRIAASQSISDPENPRSKSKSPRRARRNAGSEPEEDTPPIPDSSSTSRHRSKHSVSSAISSQPPRVKRRTMKRPHTSSGVPHSSCASESGPVSESPQMNPVSPPSKQGTPKRWISANAAVPTTTRTADPTRSPTKTFLPFFSTPTKVTSNPSSESNGSATSGGLGGSTTSMSSEGSASRSDRSDVDDDDPFESGSRRRKWLRGRSTTSAKEVHGNLGRHEPDPGPSASRPPLTPQPSQSRSQTIVHREIIPPSATNSEVQAWEEELTRIEATSSKKSSTLLSFFGKKPRS